MHSIILVTEPDLPAISELAAFIWRACYRDLISSGQIEYMLARMYSPEALRADLRSGIRYDRLFVDGEFIGFSACGPTSSAATFKLHKLYLHPDHHGCGLGSRLLRHCEQEVRARGARRLVLAVNKRNAKAIAAYERNGFRISESIVTDIGSGFVMDDYVMTKELT